MRLGRPAELADERRHVDREHRRHRVALADRGPVDERRRVAEVAVQRLKRLGMLVEAEDKTWTRGAAKYRIGDDIATVASRKAHAQNLQLALSSLENDPKELRDFSTMTFAIDVEKLPQAKACIRQLQDELNRLAETGPKLEIYKFCTQLIPLTKTL
jgi:uncharacterized protein (TIGR02147 family)